MTYLYEKLYVAVSCLSTGKGDVRSRLKYAYLSGLIRLKVEDIPEKFQKDWGKYIDRLTSYDPVYAKHDDSYMLYSALENSLMHMKNKTGEKIAKFIFDLFIFESNNYGSKN